LIIYPSKGLRIDRALPGDKSISHRALILAAIAEGASVIRNISTGADVESTIRCLEQIGIKIQKASEELIVNGKGLYGFQAPAKPLDCGNSGTTARLLTGILAGQTFTTRLSGDNSLSQRPMKRIADPLTQMGAALRLSESGTMPFEISGRQLNGITYTLPIPSAQVKSCILLAGLYAEGETRVIEPVPSRDHTERMLGSVKRSEHNGAIELVVKKGQTPKPMNITIPGDFSSAVFLITVGLMAPDSKVTLRQVGLNPTRVAFLDVLRKMGARVTIENHSRDEAEPYGDISVETLERPLRSICAQGKDIPGLIDEIPALAVLGTRTDAGLEVRDAGELRHKECDRISAIVHNLRAMGAEVDEFDDGFFVHPSAVCPGPIRSYGDHRIAMAFTAAALSLSGKSSLDDPACVDVSFPEFFEYAGIPAVEHELSVVC
jgi:3-phosphoshikimate 1-carboxyvinyltransferase